MKFKIKTVFQLTKKYQNHAFYYCFQRTIISFKVVKYEVSSHQHINLHPKSTLKKIWNKIQLACCLPQKN